MELIEVLTLAQKKFDRDVRSNIGNPDMAFIAQMEMLNIVYYLSGYSDLISSYHSGPILLTYSGIISRKYNSNKTPGNHNFEQFRAFLAQTLLSVQTNNTESKTRCATTP